MLSIKRQKYFYYIVIILIATSFFPLLSYYLPRYVGSHHFWAIIWVVSLLFFYPAIFFSKPMKSVLIYGFFLLVALITIWRIYDGWNFAGLLNEFYQISIAVSVLSYFQYTKDWIGLAKVTKWTLIFIFITAIMTIVSSAIDPMYARHIIGLSAIATNESERQAILNLQRFGGGGYGTAQVFMCIFPLLIYYFKNNGLSLLTRSQIVIYAILIFIALLSMQIFGNIIIAIIFSTIALMGMKKMKRTILVISLFLFITLIIPKEVYVNTLNSIADNFKQKLELNYKFKDLAIFIETGADIEGSSTVTGSRAARYPVLMKTFIKRPILGYFYNNKDLENIGNVNAGGHLYWMYKLTITGVLGFIFFLLVPYFHIKNSLRYFDSIYKFFYIIASLAILSYGLIKVVGGRETWYTFYVILPGFYYLPLLKKSDKKHRIPRKKWIVKKEQNEGNS